MLLTISDPDTPKVTLVIPWLSTDVGEGVQNPVCAFVAQGTASSAVRANIRKNFFILIIVG